MYTHNVETQRYPLDTLLILFLYFVFFLSYSNLNPNMSLISSNSSMPLNGDSGSVPNAVLQGSTSFPFSGVGNPTDMSGMGMDVPANFPSDASFHSTENHTQNGMGSLQITSDTDTGGGREAIGLLSHLPRNFSLSDLTAELSSSTGNVKIIIYVIHIWFNASVFGYILIFVLRYPWKLHWLSISDSRSRCFHSLFW